MFFKYIDEYTVDLAPNPLIIGDLEVFTNDEKIYNQEGYYEMEYLDYPNDGKIYTQRYIAATPLRNTIIQGWKEIDIPLAEILEV